MTMLLLGFEPSTFQLTLLSPLVLAIASIAYTYVSTTLRFHLYFHHERRHASPGPRQPPLIPYALPIIGSAFSFLLSEPHTFWASLRAQLPSDYDACRIMLGGMEINILFTAQAAQSVFKSKGASREAFNKQIATLGLGIEERDADMAYHVASKEELMGQGLGEGVKLSAFRDQASVHTDFMLTTSLLDVVMKKFVEFFSQDVGEWKRRNLEFSSVEPAEKETRVRVVSKEFKLNNFLREIMFPAATNTIYGPRLLELHPDMAKDYFKFDEGLLYLFYGLPGLFRPYLLAARKKLVAQFQSYSESGWRIYNDDPANMPSSSRDSSASPSSECFWEPVFGSPINRARERFLRARNISRRSVGTLQLGFMFGLQSNTLPTTAWILLHILAPSPQERRVSPHLLRRILAEIRTAIRPSRTLDIATLSALPLLGGLFHETLRFYTDVIVARSIQRDVLLDGNGMILKPGTVAMAPSPVAHFDDSFWSQYNAPASAAEKGEAPQSSVPAHQFHAERFMKRGGREGQGSISSTDGTSGHMYPFGGGGAMCPGRVIAKQEVFVAVAVALLELLEAWEVEEDDGEDIEIEVVGYVDSKGRETKRRVEPMKDLCGAGVKHLGGDVVLRLVRKERQ